VKDPTQKVNTKNEVKRRNSQKFGKKKLRNPRISPWEVKVGKLGVKGQPGKEENVGRIRRIPRDEKKPREE